MMVCDRCHRFTHCPHVTAHAQWCDACSDKLIHALPLREACQEFHHDYRGSRTGGCWVCLICGATLAGNFTHPPDPPPPTYDPGYD
jgi:hypothetical protein